MLNFFYEFIPVLLFFLAFKFYGIYAATLVGIVATAVQVVMTRLILGRFDKKQVTTLIVFVIFGGLTFYFHNPIFIKWKPTIIFWFFATALFCSRFLWKKSLLERLFDGVNSEKNLSIPKVIWQRLTYAWIIFFLILGTINLYFAYYFSTDVWVNFKFYGILGSFLLFSIIQAIYVSRYFTGERS